MSDDHHVGCGCGSCYPDTYPPLPPPVDPEVMTVEEGAKFLRIGRRQMYEAIGRLEIPHQRIGRIIRLHKSALVRFLAGSCEATSKGSK